jgi:hypothetical protein
MNREDEIWMEHSYECGRAVATCISTVNDALWFDA